MYSSVPRSLMPHVPPHQQHPSLPGYHGTLPNHAHHSTEVTPCGSTCLPLSEALGTGRRQDPGSECEELWGPRRHRGQPPSTEISAPGTPTARSDSVYSQELKRKGFVPIPSQMRRDQKGLPRGGHPRTRSGKKQEGRGGN